MPYFKIETNQKLDGDASAALAREASTFLSDLLGKPERVIMVSVCAGTAMTFNETDSPVAYIEIKSIGLAQEKCPPYSKAVCEFIEKTIHVPADRIYIDFANIDGKMFGWNKQTF